MINITDLRGLVLRSTKIEEAVEFYETLWGLKKIDSWQGDNAFFEATGDESFVLGLVPDNQRGIETIRFALGSPEDVDNSFAELKKNGQQPLDEPGSLSIPGEYYGFHLQDLDGTKIELSATTTTTTTKTNNREDPFAPQRLSHLVVNSPDNVALRDFYINCLGLKLADWYKGDLFFFLRCNQQHHVLGVERSDNSSLNHVAFHVEDLDTMMRRIGVMANAGHKPVWGPGRHGPGNNCFCYFEGPDGFVLEFTSELIEVTDGEEWTPKEWIPGPESANVWGTGGRTEQAIKLMSGKED